MSARVSGAEVAGAVEDEAGEAQRWVMAKEKGTGPFYRTKLKNDVGPEALALRS